MSVRAISWAYGQSLGSASQKAVPLHLAYLARIALGDQNLAAVHGNGDIVPANRRPKVWILRLDHSGKADRS